VIDIDERPEIWKDINGLEGSYQISNKGKVRSLTRVIVWKDRNRKSTFKGGLVKTFKDKYGYLQVKLQTKNRQTGYSVHKLVATAFIPNPFNLPLVNHIDTDKTNNVVDNLEWTTPKGNTAHAVKNGVHANMRKGKKLTPEDIPTIRRRKASGESPTKIAADYKIHRCYLYQIVNGSVWGHV
jgi:hypothetical protein